MLREVEAVTSQLPSECETEHHAATGFLSRTFQFQPVTSLRIKHRSSISHAIATLTMISTVTSVAKSPGSNKSPSMPMPQLLLMTSASSSFVTRSCDMSTASSGVRRVTSHEQNVLLHPLTSVADDGRVEEQLSVEGHQHLEVDRQVVCFQRNVNLYMYMYMHELLHVRILFELIERHT